MGSRAQCERRRTTQSGREEGRKQNRQSVRAAPVARRPYVLHGQPLGMALHLLRPARYRGATTEPLETWRAHSPRELDVAESGPKDGMEGVRGESEASGWGAPHSLRRYAS